MSENEVIELFSQFGYCVRKFGDKYSVFDRRIVRRIGEYSSLSELQRFAEIMHLEFFEETFERTIKEFERILSPVTDPESQPAPVTGEEKQSDLDPEQEQEQEETTAPVSPETEQKDNPEKDSPVLYLYTKTCKGCGKEFQTAHKQSMYCSPACYPSNKEKQSPSPESPSKPVAVQRPF